ncbi:MAG: hypothetical protein KA132_08240 [Thauera sp.]|jgi:hypothetical protein|uniref:hypothetical protein n=1 Tax=Thauera terpenica TaxID=76113 RepID=UPI0004CE05A6|nr:hypothetical protein [Thauera terpenica]MBP6727183.1 hypothetical protein [Thauera sp.]
MKHRLHRLGRLLPVVALLGVMYGSPAVAQTTDQAQASPPASSVAALQARMKSIRETTDPAHRMVLMEEQIKALEAASQGALAGCPMMGGQMMGGQMGAGPMMKGGGAGPGAGPMGGMMMDPKLMQEHMKTMQEHMSMMQNMMKMHPAAKPAMPN